MTLELAKILKENKFPIHKFELAHEDVWCNTCGYSDICRPSLEELIEACGEKFVSLNKVIDPKGWSCEIENEDEEIIGETFGHTPDEACASLWLTLNDIKP